ncbi:hypothetical protein [Robiginitalea aurantiaca]|uniref:Uncharacterized protein n=1 Tax=Robiginitalea aurantiaca TaxID=3056915 RepID=A0ABT7WG39_9FLAO|nr:hypothetical protein [Robiginitalea aurantiaca]MDM9631779.1 hypothetical protein [Robiginitalea aurantiaca]
MSLHKEIQTQNRSYLWKFCLYTSLLLLSALIVFSFYGLYSNRFYFLKVDNYIFPLFSVLHFVFLYVLNFKIREGEYPDPIMRNIEYGMYAVLLIYIFKCFDTYYILMSYEEYQSYMIPETFIPIGLLILSLHLLLVGFTFLSFYQRKVLIGSYEFEQIDKNMNSWQ